jgi:hypothetical protein
MEFCQEILLENQEISSLLTQRKKRWHHGDKEITEKKVGNGVWPTDDEFGSAGAVIIHT